MVILSIVFQFLLNLVFNHFSAMFLCPEIFSKCSLLQILNNFSPNTFCHTKCWSPFPQLFPKYFLSHQNFWCSIIFFPNTFCHTKCSITFFQIYLPYQMLTKSITFPKCFLPHQMFHNFSPDTFCHTTCTIIILKNLQWSLIDKSLLSRSFLQNVFVTLDAP